MWTALAFMYRYSSSADLMKVISGRKRVILYQGVSDLFEYFYSTGRIQILKVNKYVTELIHSILYLPELTSEVNNN